MEKEQKMAEQAQKKQQQQQQQNKRKKHKQQDQNSSAKRATSSHTSILRRYATPFIAIFIAVFTILAFCISFNITKAEVQNDMGRGASEYNEDIYKAIETAIALYASTDTVHNKAVNNSPEATEPSFEEILSLIETGKTTEEIKKVFDEKGISGVGGIDIPILKSLMDHTYSDSYGEETYLVCEKDNGYFQAIVTVTFSTDFSEATMERNFGSLGNYLNHYWADFFSRMFFGILVKTAIADGILLVALGILYLALREKSRSRERVQKSDTSRTTEQRPIDVSSTRTGLLFNSQAAEDC